MIRFRRSTHFREDDVTTLDDAVVARIRFTALPGKRELVSAIEMQYEPEVEDLVGMLSSAHWLSSINIAEAVERRGGAGWNDAGFHYGTPNVLDSWEEPFEGVRVYTPVSEALVGTHAFELVIVRYLHAVLEAAATSTTPFAKESRWPDVKATLERIESRLRSERATP
jgi:hypothetical protein